jgi:hypothetical protein
MPAQPFDTTRDLPFSLRLAQSDMGVLCDFWIALGGAHRVPFYRDFDPMRVPRLLPDLQIYRREADGGYRIGLTGGRVADLAGADNSGKRLADVLPSAFYLARAALFDGALDTGMPVAYRSYLNVPGREHRFYKRMLLPFVDKGPGPDLLLGMVLSTLPFPGDPSPAKDGIIDMLVATRAELRPSTRAA